MGGAKAAEVVGSLPLLDSGRGRPVVPVVGPGARRWLRRTAMCPAGRCRCAERANPKGSALPAKWIGGRGRDGARLEVCVVLTTAKREGGRGAARASGCFQGSLGRRWEARPPLEEADVVAR
eukprot:11372381-Alexandrium_andersonii.AAC.1